MNLFFDDTDSLDVPPAPNSAAADEILSRILTSVSAARQSAVRLFNDFATSKKDISVRARVKELTLQLLSLFAEFIICIVIILVNMCLF